MKKPELYIKVNHDDTIAINRNEWEMMKVYLLPHQIDNFIRSAVKFFRNGTRKYEDEDVIIHLEEGTKEPYENVVFVNFAERKIT